jgi:3-dehydroquinate synthetase
MVGDKKNVGGKINWTLLKRIGQAVFNIKIPLTIIKESLDSVLN